MRLNIKEIAQLMGVSPSTVSLVLNGKKGVSDPVRQKISACLVENGYIIKNNQADTSFAKDKRLLFVYYRSTNWISNRRDNFLVRVLDGIETGCKKHMCSFTITYASYDNLETVLSTAKTNGFDGIIFLGSEYWHDDAKVFISVDIPIVCLDRPFDSIPVNSVFIDSSTGMYQAINMLCSLGHKKIGYLSSEVPAGSLKNRKQCFFDVMKEQNLEINEKWSVDLNFLKEESSRQFDEYLNSVNDIPTAFIAANDVIASAALYVLQKKGYRVPEDISLVGFDDSSVSTLITPNLTTIRAEIERMAEISVERLRVLSDTNDKCIYKIGVGSQLVIRDSAGSAKS